MLFSIAFIFWRAFIKRKWLKNKKLNGMALSILFLHACVCYVHSVILSHKKAFYAKPATMKYLRLLFVLFLLPASVLAARKPVVEHVHPTCWWSGMHHKQLQVLLHGPQLAACEVTVNGNGLVVDSVVRPSGGNYLLLYLNVEHAAPQTFHIALAQGKQRTVVPYTLHSREVVQRHTFGPADVVYLLMPDRFANALPGNDRVPGLRDQQASQEPDARHGGDLEGMRRGLDYLADLGVTAVWPTPLLVNDMPATTYHGYAITDYYEIDPRYGSNADYRRFVAEAHDKGIKVLQDMVFNHCGSYNFLFADRPDDTWFNNHSVYEQTRYKLAALTDPHAVQADAHNATDGWFVECMPDLNQRNPHVMTYLTQNSIWWIEYAHIDGIRQDTYPYADRQAMARWCQAVQAEYPGFNIVGETWINSNVAVSMWQKDSPLVPADRNAMLPTVMDFPLNGLLCSALDEATNEWDRFGPHLRVPVARCSVCRPLAPAHLPGQPRHAALCPQRGRGSQRSPLPPGTRPAAHPARHASALLWRRTGHVWRQEPRRRCPTAELPRRFRRRQHQRLHRPGPYAADAAHPPLYAPPAAMAPSASRPHHGTAAPLQPARHYLCV